MNKSLKTSANPCLPDLEGVKRFFRKYAGDYQSFQLPVIKQSRQEETKVTIDMFFDLLNKIAKDNPVHDRHWRQRRDFWRNHLANGQVEDAWMVLGKKYLYDLNSLPSEAKQLGYGSFINNRAITNRHCAIIMKMKNLIVVEFSHSGALRIWRITNRHAPRLRQKYYQPIKLRWHQDQRFIHGKNWQQKVQGFIDRELNKGGNI